MPSLLKVKVWMSYESGSGGLGEGRPIMKGKGKAQMVEKRTVNSRKKAQYNPEDKFRKAQNQIKDPEDYSLSL